MVTKTDQSTLSLVDADIDELQHALSVGIITCVELVTAYLTRISTYDCRGPALNSIPILNPRVFDEAAASDERRARGTVRGPLDGIPFTVKDSYKVKDQTVASGSPAFQDLISNEDAFTVRRLREAGAILIGKTNMCPMAAGGMQRGIYGRAESPYNAEYLAAAFASGSSNGSGVSTAASFAAFGMGEETVSSGRSPASNNALVAYTPSRGAISIRGNWPLYPTCDVVVPHTRSVDDLLAVLDVITAYDNISRGDFWRDQQFVKIASPWNDKPSSFRYLANTTALTGMRIAVPSMYIGGEQIAASAPVYTCPEVIALYQRAKSDLEALGATVIEVTEFPVMRSYELANASSMLLPESHRLPDGWNVTERSILIAYAWEQFLRDNDDFNIPSLRCVDHREIYPPHPPEDPQIRYAEPLNRIHYERIQSCVKSTAIAADGSQIDPRSALMSISDLHAAVTALESMRKNFFEDWLDRNSFDCVIFPACGDVGRSDADVNHTSAEHAWKNGVKYSNGNRALRHLGIPSVTVPMGVIEGKDMPVGLTFIGKSGEDIQLLQWAYAYEKASKRRTSPKLTPGIGIGKDAFASDCCIKLSLRKTRPELRIEKCIATPTSRDGLRINIAGFVTCAKSEMSEDLKLDIMIDGQSVSKEKVNVQRCHGTMCGRPVYDFRCSVIVQEPPKQHMKNIVASRRRIARDSTMVVVVAQEGSYGWGAGYLKLL